jgi:hypothetical protein
MRNPLCRPEELAVLGIAERGIVKLSHRPAPR